MGGLRRRGKSKSKGDKSRSSNRNINSNSNSNNGYTGYNDNVVNVVPPHVQKLQELASLSDNGSVGSGRVRRMQEKKKKAGRRPAKKSSSHHKKYYDSDGYPQPPSYNTPAYDKGSRQSSFKERFGKIKNGSNHSDDGCSVESFATGSSHAYNPYENRPPQTLECNSNSAYATSSDDEDEHEESLHNDDGIDYGYNDYSNPTPAETATRLTTSLGKGRNHALSYGGSSEFEDLHTSNTNTTGYDYIDRDQSGKQSQRNPRQNGGRNSISLKSNTYSGYGSRSSIGSSDDSSYYNDDEFSLNGGIHAGGGGGGYGYGYGNNNNLSDEESSPFVRDALDYTQVNRHQKDLASLGHQTLEKMAQKPGQNPQDETFKVLPDYAYKDTYMTRRQLRKETNAKSAYYHDMRLHSQSKKELGQLRVEILQCFGLPTTSLIREVSAYAVAVHGNAAFQTDVMPSVANPMWLSKMRRACLFPVHTMYSQLYIGIFDLEPLMSDPDTHIGHPGHPGWVPPEHRGFGGFHPHRGSIGSHRKDSMGHKSDNGDKEFRHHHHHHHHHYSNPDRRERRRSNDSGRRGSGETNENDDDENGQTPVEYCTKAEDFIGHVVIDLCRIRPGSTYDVTLPLRRSKHVFTREPQGSVRVRLHLMWNAEQKAVMSYLPKSLGGTVDTAKQPNTRFTVNCVDDRAARNVAHTIHGIHMPGKFDLQLVKSTIREIHWTRVHVLRYVRKREIYHLTHWVYPSISCFVFCAWMHAVYFGTLRYVPGHIVVFFMLHLLKNYAYYAMDSPLQNGFYAPTLEELYWALMRGTRKRKKQYIEPITVERESTNFGDAGSALAPLGNSTHHQGKTMDELYDENGNLVHVSRYPISEIADAMRKKMRVRPHRKGFTVFKHAFQGDDAVDFLVNHGFAMTRPEAVSLGRRLEREKRLFEHITREVYFEDSPYVYSFLNDDDRFIIKKSHTPKGGKLLELLGFYSRNPKSRKGKKLVGGADILEAREHVEFPFATGVDHPRFTVKESLVIRSSEEKEKLGKQNAAKDIVEAAEFGIVPTPSDTNHAASSIHGGPQRAGSLTGGVSGYESERDTKMTGSSRSNLRIFGSERETEEGPLTGANFVRRGSMLVGKAVVDVASGVVTGVAEGANFVTAGLAGTIIRGRNANAHLNSTSTLLEVATGEKMYKKLRDQNNADLDRALDLQRKADEYDPYQYDSDNDVGTIQKKKRKKYVIHEKHLRRPISQELGANTPHVDMSLGKALEKSKRELHKAFYHMFDDPVYKIDKNLFPTRMDAKAEKEITKKKKLGLFHRKASKEELRLEEERLKQLQLTPYDKQKEDIDKLLLINEYSHSNPWINRVAIVMQPLLEMSQTVLFAFRAGFNVLTWQDPVLCFWLCFLGPPLAFFLYVFPYRIISFVVGVYWIGPQNYIFRVYRESRPGYEPPNFDLVVKKKKIEKVEDFQEMQFFSSESPGNQQIRFRNIDPLQVKQIVVPSNVLMYNRFYDWPPEPEYARVYASPPPKNLITPGYVDDMDGYESDATFIFDQAARNNPTVSKKKKKKGFRKVTSKIKKGTRATIGGVEQVVMPVLQGTEQVFGSTAGVTVGAMKGTAKMTKNVVLGTGKQAKSAAKGTGNFLRLRRKKSRDYSESDDDYY